MWIVGMYCHGGMTGITSLTRERPFLNRLLFKFVKQKLPQLTFTSVSIAIDATLKPHRDLNNAVGSDAGIIGISSFAGGKLWVEDPSGTVKRRISPHVVRTGVLLDVCQKAQTFNPRQWHGADPHQGIRATIVGYETA